SAAGAAAGASGLVAGGVVTSLAGWRAVFWLNLPLAAVLILTVLRTVPSAPRTPRVRLDVLGAGLFTAAVMGLVLGASLLEQRASRAGGAVLVGAGALLLAIFARAQRIVPEPLLPAAAARSPRLRAGAGGAFLNTATTSSVVTLATLYLQHARGVGPAAAGLRLVPFSICVVLGSTVAGRLLAQRDPCVGLTAGLGAIAIGDAGLLAVPLADGLLSVCVAIAGLGIGLSSVAATALGTNVPGELQGAAAGILNSAAQVGTALGVSAAVLIAGATEHVPFPVHGPRLSWALAALFAASGSLLALRRLRRDARASSSGRRSLLPAQDRSGSGDAVSRGASDDGASRSSRKRLRARPPA
ncbi:MAG: MFS transporter, partial [Solirubrobacteraceae bacterium]